MGIRVAAPADGVIVRSFSGVISIISNMPLWLDSSTLPNARDDPMQGCITDFYSFVHGRVLSCFRVWAVMNEAAIICV